MGRRLVVAWGLGALGCVGIGRLLWEVGGTPEAAAPVSAQVTALVAHVEQQCWITYTPTAFDPTTTPMTWPSRESVEADLQALAAVGVRGLVTYRSFFWEDLGAGNGFDGSQTQGNQTQAQESQTQESQTQANQTQANQTQANQTQANQTQANQVLGDRPLPLPQLAIALGFEAMVLGIWDPHSEAELQAAAAAAASPVVWGYSVGNEGLGRRYDRATLTAAMDRLRQTTGLPVTTTEEIPDYWRDRDLRRLGDWIFPNVHPYFAGLHDPQRAADWTAVIYGRLDALGDRPVVFKEVGLPTAGDPQVSEANQRAYYQALAQTGVAYVNFAAFDLPWKQAMGQGILGTSSDNPEPHWGVFGFDRRPKPAALGLCGAGL
ncbi:hypothetical protein [Prochlorothrix hollandica]|uniref:hypothetical protein n=1 Tax=Prochlorothrix hollandica TaxID=1223 RepID=UPI003DA6FAA9